MEDLAERRIQVVRDHMALECVHDWDAVIATFQHPRYEMYGSGAVFDGEAAVRGYFAASRTPFPDQGNEVIAIARDDMQRSQHDARRKSGDERAKVGPQDESRTKSGGRSVASGGKHSSSADPFAQSPSDATTSQTRLPPATVDPFDPAGFNRSSSRGAGR